jgi:molybdopterin molybdotransferase
MVVLKIVIIPFLNKLKGLAKFDRTIKTRAKLTRNISSAQGRRDFVRVELIKQDGQILAKPVLGKSGLIKTMIHADGLLEISDNVEGLEKNTIADIILL